MTAIFVFSCFEAFKIAIPVAISKFWVINLSSFLMTTGVTLTLD